MKVINKNVSLLGSESFVTYDFDSGHKLRTWYSGHSFGYTPKGNYTSQVTLHKLARIASDFEDHRLQTN